MTLAPVLGIAALTLAAGFLVTVVLPATSDANTTRTGATRTYTVGQVKGHRVYSGEGCVTCHTMQVREAYTDAGLRSRPSRPDDALNDVPALMGDTRYGPDLTCAGDRVEGKTTDDKVAAMIAYLKAPSASHHGSTMPSYRVLSDTDLRYLATYLVGLTCPEATP